MKISERYNSYNDAQQQLHNTYVELDGELAHLYFRDGWSWEVSKAYKSDTGMYKWGPRNIVDIQDADLNLEPFKLGYMNTQHDTAYVQRKPLRKWKQGIYIEYLELLTKDDGLVKGGGGMQAFHNAIAGRGNRITVKDLFTTDAAIKAYNNEYPTFTRAFVEVYHFQNRGSAWSREWAFRNRNPKGIGARQVLIEYKGRTVGEVLNGKSILHHRYKYLTETFVEAMIHAS